MHIGFSRGRSGGLVLPLLSEFSTVYLSFRHLKLLIFICHINITFSNNLTLFSVDILQVECHPYLNQSKLLDFCKSHDIVLVAYGALGSQRVKDWYESHWRQLGVSLKFNFWWAILKYSTQITLISKGEWGDRWNIFFYLPITQPFFYIVLACRLIINRYLH